MIHIDASNNLTVGSNSIPLQFQTSARPIINLSSGDEKVAYLSEVESLRTEYQTSINRCKSNSIIWEQLKKLKHLELVL